MFVLHGHDGGQSFHLLWDNGDGDGGDEGRVNGGGSGDGDGGDRSAD